MLRRINPKPPGYRPTTAELRAAEGCSIRDLIAPGLAVLFCGINPGLYSGATGHHFARPGNRFWRALYDGGFTERVLAPWEEGELLAHHVGITNMVARTTATAAEVEAHEYIAGRRTLERKIRKYAPQWLAVVGIGAYRLAFARPKAVIGRQDERIGQTQIWVLPNPSGLNANHQAADLGRMFRAMQKAAAE